ncbi:MAG: hypothetical protein ACXABY_36795 [Candidatus Thorarchaeota archaeon]|jgi:hypothetical protein
MKGWLEKYKLALTIVTTIVVIFATAWSARAYLDGYCTDAELFEVRAEIQAVSDESKCGDIVYRIDKILSDMFEIESRYTDGQDMTRTDKKRYKKLKKRLKRWEGYEKDLGCEPDE